MKTQAKAAVKYVSPALDMLEIITEGLIASSVGGADSNSIGVDNAIIDDWGTL